jgi:2-haloacid dehalogenase
VWLIFTKTKNIFLKDTINGRRKFISSVLIAGGVSAMAPASLFATENIPATALPSQPPRPKVLFFDVNETLLDLNAMKASIGKVLNNRTDLLPLWFTTMLQYSLVSTVANQYHDFGAVGAAALLMVARNNNIPLTDVQAKEAIKPILSLPPHKEVEAALMKLKQAGFTMVSFTNSSNKAVQAQLDNAKLSGLFDAKLSIEDLGKFKPHTDAYNWAARKMGVKPADCLLVAAHGWDVAGAQWAGWRTAFISRPGQQLYPLAEVPEINVPDLAALADTLVAMK